MCFGNRTQRTSNPLFSGVFVQQTKGLVCNHRVPHDDSWEACSLNGIVVEASRLNQSNRRHLIIDQFPSYARKISENPNASCAIPVCLGLAQLALGLAGGRSRLADQHESIPIFFRRAKASTSRALASVNVSGFTSLWPSIGVRPTIAQSWASVLGTPASRCSMFSIERANWWRLGWRTRPYAWWA